MATTGKKGRQKWKSVDPSLIINTSTLPVKPVSWAEAAEEEREALYAPSRPVQSIVLPSAPRASIDAEVYERTVPHEGPFMAYLSNLSFDIAEDEIYEFFQDLKVARVDLPRDDRSGNGRCKGYGHVEFQDRTSLIDALGFIDATIKGRRVRIDLPNAQDERQQRGQQGRQYRDRNQGDRERPDRDEETSGDWRSAPRAEAQERRRPYGGRDSYNRDEQRGARSPRRGGFRSEDSVALMTRDDFGTAKPAPLPERSRGGGGGGFTERREGGGGGREGGRAFDRSEMKDPSQMAASPDREFTRDSRPRENRERDSGRSFDRTEMREPPKDLSPPSEPKTRPKLNLAPRTKPIETPAPLPQPPLDTPPEEPTPPPAPKPSAASIFGGAKPVDTAAREREIEEKLKAKATPAEAEETSRSREVSPSPKENTESETPAAPENVWAKRSQQMTTSNITNGTSPDSSTPEDSSSESRRPPVAEVTPVSDKVENDENRQPAPEKTRDGEAKDRDGGGWRESGPRRDERGPRREFGGPPRGDRDMNRDNKGDNRGFRNNDDRGKRPMIRDNRDSNNRDNHNRDRDSRGPPRRNFDNDRPPRRDDNRDDNREIRRNPNNNNNRDNEIRRGGGRPGAPNKDSPAPASTGSQGTPAQAEPAKPKPKKAKEVDITKMPKVQASKGIDFAQDNKFSLLPDEEEVEGEDEDI